MCEIICSVIKYQAESYETKWMMEMQINKNISALKTKNVKEAFSLCPTASAIYIIIKIGFF